MSGNQPHGEMEMIDTSYASNAEMAEAIITALKLHGVPPDASFTASAGRDYGQVDAWEINEGAQTAIAYGDNGETNYAIADGDEGLGEWLEHQDLDGVDASIEQANIYGLDTIAAETARECTCAVLIEHSYYGPYTRCDAARDDSGEVLEFEGASAAQAWIDEEDSGIYTTQHNETGRPIYKVVSF